MLLLCFAVSDQTIGPCGWGAEEWVGTCSGCGGASGIVASWSRGPRPGLTWTEGRWLRMGKKGQPGETMGLNIELGSLGLVISVFETVN